jgi:hypothetical protein
VTTSFIAEWGGLVAGTLLVGSLSLIALGIAGIAVGVVLAYEFSQG